MVKNAWIKIPPNNELSHWLTIIKDVYELQAACFLSAWAEAPLHTPSHPCIVGISHAASS